MSVNVVVKVNDTLMRRALILAQPRILAKNALVATQLMNEIKTVVVAATPVGPGHFGYHGRDTVHVTISVSGNKTTAKLMASMQLYWREYGTGVRFRGKGKGAALKQATRVMTGAASGGEPAFMVANKAMAGFKRLINAYYGSMAAWWNA
jgi:hypothetical protein